MLFRTLVLGMLGAIALLIATLPAELDARRTLAAEPANPGIVHVSRRALEASPLSFDQTIAGAIGLGEDEQISQIDLSVRSGVTVRRVVVVVEP